uniref:Mechanosensitive ion channel protein n=1 Tax=Spongospora subterranea TaxID=70186 RepID=A0A0H5RAR4_9EUKA|eukprot:CRZ10861.1 hypothetical protein [Spongospora subterranea]
MPSWLFPLVQKSSSGYIRVIIMAASVEGFILDWWLDTRSFNSKYITIAHAILQSLYVVGIVFICRNMSNVLLEMWAAAKSFGKRIEAIVFLEKILQDLCCRNQKDREALDLIRQAAEAKNYLLSSALNIRDNPMVFPLIHEEDRWSFSTEASIEVSTVKDMGLIAEIVFANIVEDSRPTFNAFKEPVISLETFASYFHTPLLGVKCFRLMFLRQGNAMLVKEVTQAQFVAAFQSIINTRSVLANRLKSFANLLTLANTVISGMFWLLIIFIVCRNFGYELNQLITTISALILGVSFALSKTISRAVESVVFVFGSKPYQVNDGVIILGDWYQVHHIGLLETQFLDRVNKRVRFSNQFLADIPIINMTNSFGCVTRIAIQICFDTSMETLEKLKASILKYTVMHPEHWKPRVTVFLNDISTTTSVELEIRIESVYRYVDGGTFRIADTELKHHIRKKMYKLGIEFLETTKPLEITKLPTLAGQHSKPVGTSAATHPVKH